MLLLASSLLALKRCSASSRCVPLATWDITFLITLGCLFNWEIIYEESKIHFIRVVSVWTRHACTLGWVRGPGAGSNACTPLSCSG